VDGFTFRGVQVIQLATISPQQEVALGRQINQGLLESGNTNFQ
jgi:predicted Zn-dependent protease